MNIHRAAVYAINTNIKLRVYFSLRSGNFAECRASVSVMSSPYACVPPCRSCREAEMCMKAIRVQEAEDVRAREYSHSWRQIKIPCGCYALPMDILVVFGENIERVQCSQHGWQELTSKRKQAMTKKVKEEQARNRQVEDVIPNDPYLFDVPPY